VIAVLIIDCLLLSACTWTAPSGEKVTPPAIVERIEGKNSSRVILTKEADKRLGIETTLVQNEQVRGKLRKVIPYPAVFYDLNGATWVYTNPSALTYIRAPISVDYIDGNLAVLSQGPPSGTAVVTVGASELYGTEFGVGE
jgi:hypothetical protein